MHLAARLDHVVRGAMKNPAPFLPRNPVGNFVTVLTQPHLLSIEVVLILLLLLLLLLLSSFYYYY
jgi:hypothetical protein